MLWFAVGEIAVILPLSVIYFRAARTNSALAFIRLRCRKGARLSASHEISFSA